MKKVEVLSVGTELLMGQIANTNAQYISRRFPEIGLGVFYHSVVGDNPERLTESLYIALRRSDVVVTTGGLGPTQDDLTKETVAEALGLPMELNLDCKAKIEEYFFKTGREMPANNYRQAYFPKGCILMENGMGTAPGCIVETEYEGKEKIIILLPGPPKELVPMFDNCVLPYFKEKAEHRIYSVFLKVIGVGESKVEDLLIDTIDGQTNPTVATYAKDGIVTIRVTANDESGEEPEKLVENTVEKICDILGENVYARLDEEPEFTVYKMLKERGMTMAAAESCTGGLISQKMTAFPGSSAVFKCSAVVYTAESKCKLLGVSEDTIEKYGVVSGETALEMVQGVCALSGADCGISVTGYAGPTSDPGMPVGLVYIGIKCFEYENVHKFIFNGNRERVRTLCAVNAYDLLRRAVKAADIL